MTAPENIKAPETALAEAAAAFAAAKLTDPSERKDSTTYAWLTLCDAICRVVPDGDAAEAASQARFDLGLDEEGRPTDDFGFPLFEFNPSRVHPDDGCQSKGWV